MSRSTRPRGPLPMARRTQSPTRSGFTSVEVVIVIAILAVALSMFASTATAVVREQAATRQRVIASEAARVFLERLRDEDLSALFARYNGDPADDPGGPGTAPGPRFAVPGLDPGDAPDGLAGEVRFPALEVALPGGGTEFQLREDLADPTFGTPRDLDGDSLVDDADHAGDYLLLPLEVVVRWRGRSGVLESRTFATLCEFNWQ